MPAYAYFEPFLPVGRQVTTIRRRLKERVSGGLSVSNGDASFDGDSTLKTASRGDCSRKTNQTITVSNDSDQDARIAALQAKLDELKSILAGRPLAFAAVA